jgi:type IV/VI secretion system ImpK/VasF family protein
MTLLQATEPIFQFVCRLNRLSRRSAGGAPAAKGDTGFFTKAAGASSAAPVSATLDYAVVRSEVKALLAELNQKAGNDGRLMTQVRKVELPLIFFIDSMIAESKLSFAGQWNKNRLAFERNELAGDEKFFDLLDETMKDSSDEASERLAVFYICLGLGFTGIYFQQPELLRKTMLTIAPRIIQFVERDSSSRICADAYEKVDLRNLVEPPSTKFIYVGIVFACFTLALLIAYFWLYQHNTDMLLKSFEAIKRQDLAH